MKVSRRAWLVTLFVVAFAAWGGLRLLEQSYEPVEYHQMEKGLYVGRAVKQPPPGTHVVINLAEQKDAYQTNDYVWKPIHDGPPPPSLDWLREVVELIDKRRREGRIVYVHCRNGVSRTGLVITAYFTWKHQWSRDRALTHVRSKREIIRPNPAFMELLSRWEHALQDAESNTVAPKKD